MHCSTNFGYSTSKGMALFPSACMYAHSHFRKKDFRNTLKTAEEHREAVKLKHLLLDQNSQINENKVPLHSRLPKSQFTTTIIAEIRHKKKGGGEEGGKANRRLNIGMRQTHHKKASESWRGRVYSRVLNHSSHVLTRISETYLIRDMKKRNNTVSATRVQDTVRKPLTQAHIEESNSK